MICDEISLLLELPDSAESNFIKSNRTIDLTALDSVLPDTTGILNSYEECLKTRKLIDGLLLGSGCIVRDGSFIENFSRDSQFTGKTSKLLSIFEVFRVDQNSTTETLLQLLPILEFSLGNVYLSKTGQQPPHLLKDLLQELESIIDHKHIFLLQLIVGSHKGVNLRNLLWHGFLEKVNSHFATFIFLMINSIGASVSRDEITVSRSCPQLDVPEMPFDEPFLEDDNLKKLPMMSYLEPDFLNKIMLLAIKCETQTCCYLLLPKIENVLRLIYGQLNEVDVTARIGKYYVILDSIFYDYILDESTTPLVIGKINKSQELEMKKLNRRNRLLEKFPSSLIYYGYDLFHAPDGPRVRDKLSHGEAELTQEQSERLWKILLYFIIQVVHFHSFGQLPTHQGQPLEYESRFMNNFKLVRSHQKAFVELCEFFETLKIPEALTQDPLVFKFDSTKLMTTKGQKNFFRPLDEKQIVKSMLKILETFSEALQNFSTTFKILLKSFDERKLRSRQRKSLSNLISCLPIFHEGFVGVLNVIVGVFFQCQQIDDETADFTVNIKLLKQTQQHCENLVKNFTSSNQNFFVANQDTREFLQLIDESKYLTTLFE